MSHVASFHVIADRPRRWPSAWRRVMFDRFALRGVDGLEFVRVLGTAKGDHVGPSISPGRSAVFAVWRDEEAARTFLVSHPVATRWARSDELWSCLLRCTRATGSWRGVTIDATDPDRINGRVVVVTRASIRWRTTRAFARSSRLLALSVGGADGLLAVLGFGERPVGSLGTFSVWRSRQAASDYAHSQPHLAVAGAAERERWFVESLFAVFEPIESAGRWAGRDPIGQRE